MNFTIGFSDSNEISNSSGVFCVANNGETHSTSEVPSSDITPLRRLSENLESIFETREFDFFADAKIVVGDGREVSVHRCIVSARSPFFKNVFSGSGAKERGGKFELKELAKDYDVGLDALKAVLGYLYSGRVRSLPEGVCICVDDDCSHFGCRPAVDFMVEVLYASCTFQISELVALYQRHLLDTLDKVAIDDILVVLSVANICGKICERLQARCSEIIVKSDVDSSTLEKALPQPVVKQILDKRIELGLDRPENFSFPDKHVKRIHRALESDDVELVRMLLKEGHTNLDEACALHYAVAYCDAKTTTELLDLGLADVNHKNLRGYSVLHVAAMRKEPKLIVSLLTKGAQPSDLTLDGRKALQISKRLTKAVDYYKSTEEGRVSSKDRLCIEILEQAERREPLLGEASLSLAMAGDDLRMKLLYLENRVARTMTVFYSRIHCPRFSLLNLIRSSIPYVCWNLESSRLPANRNLTIFSSEQPLTFTDDTLFSVGLAKFLFPMEAKVVMDIAQVDGTSEFPSAGIYSPNMGGSQRTTVDLNEAPFKMKEEHLIRMRALSRTVELGKRFFPRCSEVLNKIMDADDMSQLACMGNDSPEERLVKRRRYLELQEILSKAFNEDKEEFDRSTVSSSSSSTSIEPNCKLAMKN